MAPRPCNRGISSSACWASGASRGWLDSLSIWNAVADIERDPIAGTHRVAGKAHDLAIVVRDVDRADRHPILRCDDGDEICCAVRKDGGRRQGQGGRRMYTEGDLDDAPGAH